MSEHRTIAVGETEDGHDVSLPVVQILTGRGFVTGKSGSGKSNTASVIAEELLESGYPLLVVDTDGEYYGLKEEYEMLHAGADEECDIQIGPEHAEQMARLALEENVPVILDVSGYLDEGVADELLRETARQLFVKEKKLKKPFLLVVEEVHEYIPEGGGVGETGKMLIKIGKRGRKHGLGILGISQRPADVKKDFITQANWLVWHRLTWDNDTKVVGRIIDTEYAELVSDLGDGQAFIQTDWTDVGVRKIQFRRKRTFDAGATPGLDDFERPELKSVSDALVGDLQEISQRKQREESRIEKLEAELDRRDSRIDQLEDELASARDVSAAAAQMAEALSEPETVQSKLPESSEQLRRLHDEVVDLEDEREALRAELEKRAATIERQAETIDELEAEIRELELERDVLEAELESLEDERDRLSARLAALESEAGTDAADSSTSIIQPDVDAVELGLTPVETDAESTSGGADDGDDELLVVDDRTQLEKALALSGVSERLERASADSRCSTDTAREVVSVLARNGPMRTEAVAEHVGRSPVAVQSLLSELRTESMLDRPDERTYAVAAELFETLVAGEDSESDAADGGR